MRTEIVLVGLIIVILSFGISHDYDEHIKELKAKVERLEIDNSLLTQEINDTNKVMAIVFQDGEYLTEKLKECRGKKK